MSKHTPGPWRYQEDSDRYTHIVRSPTNRIVHQGPQHDDAICEANARLIAAAPELYDTLKRILDGFAQGVFVRDVTYDANPDWAIKLLPFLKLLGEAQTAIFKAEAI